MNQPACGGGQAATGFHYPAPKAERFLLRRRTAQERPARRAQLCQKALVTSSITAQQLLPALHVAAVFSALEKPLNSLVAHQPIRLGKLRQTTHRHRTMPAAKAPYRDLDDQAAQGCHPSPVVTMSFQSLCPPAIRTHRGSPHPALILLIDIAGRINSHLHDDLHPSAMGRKSPRQQSAPFRLEPENPLNLQAEPFSPFPLLT